MKVVGYLENLENGIYYFFFFCGGVVRGGGYYLQVTGIQSRYSSIQGCIQKIQKGGGGNKILARVQPCSMPTTHEHPWGDYMIPLERWLLSFFKKNNLKIGPWCSLCHGSLGICIILLVVGV